MTDNSHVFSIRYSFGLILLFLITPVLLASPLIIAHAFGYPIVTTIGLTADNFYLFVIISQFVALTVIAYLIYRRLRSHELSWSYVGIQRFSVSKALKYITGYYLIVIGLLIGIVVVASIAGVVPEQSAVPTTTSSVFGGFWLTIFFSVLVAPIIEEILFRGILFTSLKQKHGVIWAIILSGLIFSLAHIGNPVQAIGMLPMGIYLGFMYHKTGSIIPGVLLHASWNLFVTLVK